jgi:molybdopterin-guanine dinucleotide biosynthesis protein A
MGHDKALIPLAGKPMIAHALAILQQAGLSTSIAGARSSLATFAPVIDDSGQGPLSGICAALTSTTAPLAVFLPVDQPFLPPSLISVLLDHARTTGAAITVPSIAGFAETFPAVVDRSVLLALQSALDRGERGCFAAFQSASQILGRPMSIVPVEYLVQSGKLFQFNDLPPTFWFLNVNGPTDLSRAASLLPHTLQVS